MAGPVTSMAQVPLPEALPPWCSGAEGELRRLAAVLERHRSVADRVAWHWYPRRTRAPYVPDGRAHPLVVDATFTLFDTRDDWLELALDIAWQTPERLAVNAAVEVACWCPTDHNMHQVRQALWPAGSRAELTDAFAAGTAMLSAVLDSGPYEPGPWRIAADLPDAP